MTESELTQIIVKSIPDAEVMVRDLTGGGDHFEAIVVSASFKGKSRIEQQRMVFDPLKDLLKGPLHALTLKTYSEVP